MLLSLATATTTQAVDDVGDQARDFTILNHKTEEPLSLYDLEGSVILLDFFAYWCPFCRAQSPQIEEGIAELYHEQNGNDCAVPVTVLTVSFDCSNQQSTDSLIEQFGLDLVADDCNLNAYNQFGAQGQPFYVIINGATDSTSHLPWEVLHRQSSYGGTVAPLETLQGVIDQIQGPPPEITNFRLLSPGAVEFEVPAYLGYTNRVEYSTDLEDWTTLTNLSGANATMTVQDSAAEDGAQRFYRAVRE